MDLRPLEEVKEKQFFSMLGTTLVPNDVTLSYITAFKFFFLARVHTLTILLYSNRFIILTKALKTLPLFHNKHKVIVTFTVTEKNKTVQQRYEHVKFC